MPIINQEEWNAWVHENTEPYGKCCVDVARKVMEILDAEPQDFNTYKLISRADKEIKAGGITGFMAGCVATMVSKCHSRSEEFRKKWNKDNQISNEGDKANDSGGVLNPALLTVNFK